ncbi:MAG TPA: prepilin-type N-terminal cleavage/methylation domain-containing protein [Spirochaetota bacterium]|nr:prepilin-type N-terminal cleavage/methylation domain-containing protein [Spirochaetota bacterium]HPI89175.1 prepilin-type N-terminal cleavage/methylation domain-containing protein [Spirochaetota bacterium]HPR46830.1 prepilin-type N-terminal cleavage/methylation domain-containing protein [Spirochaetota bacterium]
MVFSRSKTTSDTRAFALVEILIAMAILSIVLLSIFSGVSSGIYVMSGNKNHTTAILIAKSQMNQFIDEKMRGPDLKDEPVEENQRFYLTRVTERYEHPLLGPLPAKKTTITVSWKERERDRSITISYVFAEL